MSPISRHCAGINEETGRYFIANRRLTACVMRGLSIRRFRAGTNRVGRVNRGRVVLYLVAITRHLSSQKRLLPSVWAGSEDGASPPPAHPHRKRPGSTRRPHLGQTLKPPLATPAAQPDRAQTPVKEEAGSGFVLPPPGTDLVFLREGAGSPVQVPGPAPASTETRLQVRVPPYPALPNPAQPRAGKLGPSLLPSSFTQEAQCPGLSWVVALPQVKQEKADAQEDWTPGTAILTSPVLLPGCPSKVGVSDGWSVSRVMGSRDGDSLSTVIGMLMTASHRIILPV